MSKFIGLVSAYAYAKSKGYTGTEEEFAILMAEYASVTETAVEAVRIATESAQSAAAASSDVNKAAATVTQQAAQVHDDAETSSESAATASEAKETAVDKALDSEAWAVGQRDGEDVGSSDPAYHNNAKYYAESVGTSAQTATEAAQTATAKASEAQASASAAAESARTFTIDATLTQSGQAADAKKTGDEIASITDTTYNIINHREMANNDGIEKDGDVLSGTATDFAKNFNAGIPLTKTLENGKQYIISFDAYTNQVSLATGNGIRFVLVYGDGTMDILTVPNATSTYTHFYRASDASKSLSSIEIQFGSGGSNRWFIKQLQLTKGDAEIPFIDSLTAVDAVARMNNDGGNTRADTTSLLSLRKMLPEYYFGVPENATDYTAADYMNERISTIPDGKHFIFITDVHWKNNNAKHSTAMMKYVKEKIGITDVFFGGDILNQETSKYMGAARMAEYMNEARDAFGNNFFPAQGNHDLNAANLSHVLEENPGLSEDDVRMSYKVVYKYLVEPIADKVVFEDCSAKLAQTEATGDDLEELEAYCKLHYYHDDDDQKIRYIVVCTTNTDNNGVVKQYFGARSLQEMYLQYDWIYQTLLDTPDNYDIFILGHAYVWSGPEAPAGYRPYMPHEVGVALGRMMAGLRYKTNVTVRCATNNQLLNSFYAYGAHTYAFANDSKTHHFVVGVSGDKHFDGAYILGPSATIENTRIYDAISKNDKEVLLTVTLCDARAVPEEDYNNYKPTMTAGTVNEQAFDVVTVTNDNRLVYTRFGSGTDRIFNIPL